MKISTTKVKTITIFVAGGTAGHVFSANGMAYYTKGKRVIFTDKRGEKYIDKGVFDEVHVLPIKNNVIINFYSFFKSFFKSWQILKKYPEAPIIGFGAYISLPTCFIGWVLRNSIYIYQADQIMGKANKIISFFAKKIFTASYKLSHRKSECIGLMPRANIISHPIKIDGELRILVLGGSLSSALWKFILPSALHNLPKEILQKIRIHQQTGDDKNYFVEAYKNIPLKELILDEFIDTSKAFIWSNLVISRAGMGTISDLTASMRPALLVPWRNAKDNHQTYNAKWWAKSGGGWWVPEDKFTSKYIQDFILNLMDFFDNNSNSNENAYSNNIDNNSNNNAEKKTNYEKFNSEFSECSTWDLKCKSNMLSKWIPIHGGLLAAKQIQREFDAS